MSQPPDAGGVEPATVGLARRLGVWDVAAITAGTMLGSAIFFAAAFVPRAVPNPSLVLILWAAAGCICVAGALTYAELGAMFPEAGGQYHYLKQAFGPLPAFLFGWMSVLAIQSGSIAYLGVAFGNLLGGIFPLFGPEHALRVSLGFGTLAISGGQLAAVGSILLFTAVNYFGVREGATVQGVLTAIKIVALVGLIVAGLLAPAKVTPDWSLPTFSWGLVPAAGVALVGALGGYDGWYQATFSSGELARPARDLPLGMIAGTAGLMVLYLLVNWVYLHSLPVAELGAASQIGSAATTALLGPGAGRLLAIGIAVSTFGCMSSTIVGASRIPLPMAQDGSFFRIFGRIHPRYRTPTFGVLALGVWSAVLALSGTYEQLFDYSLLATFLFHAATAAALFRLRRTEPDRPRPYRVFGYPWVPGILLVTMVAVVGNAFREQPRESLIGFAILAAGVVAYWGFRRYGAGPTAAGPRG